MNWYNRDHLFRHISRCYLTIAGLSYKPLTQICKTVRNRVNKCLSLPSFRNTEKEHVEQEQPIHHQEARPPFESCSEPQTQCIILPCDTNIKHCNPNYKQTSKHGSPKKNQQYHESKKDRFRRLFCFF